MTERWRIDDLARETGLTVDTIRYYQRQGLLPPGEREGRHRIYGPEHVERLHRIKELQTRRFSIAAIHAFVSGEHGALEEVFADAGEGVRLSADELLEQSHADPALVGVLRAAGVLRDPEDFGRTSYDGDDLEMLRAMTEMVAAGVPVVAVGELARAYAEGVQATQQRVLALFTDGGGTELRDEDIARLKAAVDSEAFVPALRRLVDYTFHRTRQRLTLARVQPDVALDPDAVDPDATEELAIASGDLPTLSDASRAR